MQTIYMDNAATTQPCGESVARAEQYLKENYFNPSAMYKEGFALSRELKAAREKLVSYVADTASYDLTFTSCGTEADNTAVFGYARRGNAVTSAGEHSAILAPFAELKNRNVAETRFAPLEADGRVNVGKLLELVDEKTTFVSVMHVNNETGAINDINAVAKKVKEKNPRVVFHSDGVQGFGKIPFRLGKEVDLYSLSAHKIGGRHAVYFNGFRPQTPRRNSSASRRRSRFDYRHRLRMFVQRKIPLFACRSRLRIR